MPLEINVTGLEAACGALDSLPDDIAKKALRKALDASMVPVLETMGPNIPVETSDLKAHLKATVRINSNTKSGTATIGFGQAGWKARLVEYGHREIGHEPNKTDLGKTVPAHPFMRPALEQAADAAVQAFADSILESFETEMSKGGIKT
jgi:HK97 gp10 family phage protein